jgi:hypothetical protein
MVGQMSKMLESCLCLFGSEIRKVPLALHKSLGSTNATLL